MKTILILGAGKEQVNAIARAKEKGIRTVVLDMNKEAEGALYADEFYAISTRDIPAILAFLKTYNKKIDGVMTIASDIPHCVSAAAEFLGVPHISLSVAQVCVQKFRMKETLQEGGVRVPAFAPVDSVESLMAFIKTVGYPVVIKPVDNSGARGVLRLSEDIDVPWAFEYAKKYSFSGNLIVEQYIEGQQISTEGIMHEGIFYCTGFSDRNYERIEKTAPYLVEDGGDIPSALDPGEQALVKAEFEKAVRALGIDWGPAKGDMVLGRDGKAYVIEVAARLSGGNFCYDKVPWSTGVDIVDILIDMAVGNSVDAKRFVPTKDMATSQRYFFPLPGTIKEIRGLEKAERMPHVKKVDPWVQAGDEISAIVNHPSRVGYVITCAPTLAEAVQAAERAVQSVEFIME
ncbi:TPA: hypothetical protein DIV48_01320 [Candidatus Kaiserbacteria bacterium]|nr:MAG: hypothetical protein UY93_C0002G0056 [Parcubacteria group bacterium GW2011_GWA1_56_13]KKW45519.1 MAG: hypothetical protein UY97_C0020G0016 [Parcubacteria group bacterium GW2011_GWB1_57_6]HCR52272.1 hypothetical protein [Candidatus Kaiserbacteria bacterium]